MTRQLVCPHGHAWEVNTLNEANHSGTPSVCPVCRATPVLQGPLTESLAPDRPRSPEDALAGPPRRRRWLLALGVLILAGAVGGLFGLHWWARQQLRTAEALLADLRFEEAGRLLDDYLRIRPSDAAAHLVAARAKRRAGDPEAAEHHLDELERLQGKTAASSLERVLLLAERGALGDKEGELRARLKKGDPDTVPLLEALVRNSLTTGRLLDAMEYVGGLLAERPHHPRALVWRARIWGELGQWDEALGDARRAVALRPGSLEARLTLAKASEHVGEIEAAAREYGWLYERGEKSSVVVLGLGRCCQDLARFAEARQVLDAFLAEQPAQADVLVERGRLALREGGTTPAEPYFRRAVVAGPNNLDAHRLLLRCLEASGNPEGPARVAGQLRQLEIREGRIEQLRSEIKAAPNDPEPADRLGLFLLQNGREEEGLNWLNGVLILDPQHAPARAALAAYSQRTGRRPGGGRP